ncbi:hypothetical protein [Deinococcus sp. Arct2-2]|nr:hypothetical protein [Deinococcus sp. Arct2-2]
MPPLTLAYTAGQEDAKSRKTNADTDWAEDSGLSPTSETYP